MSIFDLPGDIAAGVGGLFGGKDSASFDQKNLDSSTQRSIDYVLADTPGHEQGYTDALMRNTGSGGLLNAQDLGQSESALGMLSDESQRQAISNKSSRLHQSEMDALTRRAKVHGFDKAAQKLASDQDLVQKADAYNLRLAQARIGARLNEQAARNAVLGEILGMAGMVGGAALGAAGGPVGVMAGMQMGKSVGTGFAGSGKQERI